MNSLQDLRVALRGLGKTVTDFTGYSLTCDGVSWGILHDDPVRGGVSMSPKDWKDYTKAAKAGLPPPVIEHPKPQTEPIVISVKKLLRQVTCPHCGKTGGEQGMKIHHFANCKKKVK